MDHPSNDQAQGAVSEYIYQKNINDVLIPVYLLGAVNKPGLYHLPPDTDLVSLLALAGGASPEAETSHIQLKRHLPNKPVETKELSLKETMKDLSSGSPELFYNDIVLIPSKEPTFSNNTVVIVGLVATVVGVLLTAVLTTKALQK